MTRQPSTLGEVDGGQAHAARGAVHQHPFARLGLGAPDQRDIGGQIRRAKAAAWPQLKPGGLGRRPWA